MVYQNILDRLNLAISARYAQPLFFIRKVAPLLHVTSNTIYNKLSGRTRFSVEELFVILHELNIPISEIMDELPHTESYTMELMVHDYGESEKLVGLLDLYSEMLSWTSSSENSQLRVVSNTIPEFCLIGYPWLSAFTILKWIYYNKGRENVLPLNQISDGWMDSEKILRCQESIRNLNSTEYILSIDIMRNCVAELIMFYEYRMISKENAHAMYRELKELLHALEIICDEGSISDSGKRIDVYYHSTQMYGNFHLLEGDGKGVGFIYPYHLNPLVTRHAGTFDVMKSWYHSWKRSSVPISTAGLKSRMYFMSEQEKALDGIRDFFRF